MKKRKNKKQHVIASFNMIINYLSLPATTVENQWIFFSFFLFFHTHASFPLFTAVVKTPRACEKKEKTEKRKKLG